MNIVVLDPFDIDRLGFCTFIQSHSSYNLLFDTSSSDDLVSFIASNTKQVDICFLEVDLQASQSGIDLLKKLKHDFPGIKFCFHTFMEEDRSLYIQKAAFVYGATAFVSKTSSTFKLHSILQALHEGHSHNFFFNTQVENIPLLNEENIETIKMLCTPLFEKEIAHKYDMPYKTLIGRKERVMKKLGLFSRPALIAFAFCNFLITREGTSFF